MGICRHIPLRAEGGLAAKPRPTYMNAGKKCTDPSFSVAHDGAIPYQLKIMKFSNAHRMPRLILLLPIIGGTRVCSSIRLTNFISAL
jgi:hypothetical protein